jgi:hypothetical protein
MLHDLIDGTHTVTDERDHWEKEWYQEYFGRS